jgi:hypothetical protein
MGWPPAYARGLGVVVGRAIAQRAVRGVFDGVVGGGLIVVERVEPALRCGPVLARGRRTGRARARLWGDHGGWVGRRGPFESLGLWVTGCRDLSQRREFGLHLRQLVVVAIESAADLAEADSESLLNLLAVLGPLGRHLAQGGAQLFRVGTGLTRQHLAQALVLPLQQLAQALVLPLQQLARACLLALERGLEALGEGRQVARVRLLHPCERIRDGLARSLAHDVVEDPDDGCQQHVELLRWSPALAGGASRGGAVGRGEKSSSSWGGGSALGEC